MIIAAMFFIIPAPAKKKSGGEFFTDLVSPEELYSRKPVIPPSIPKARSAPPSRPKSASPSPATTERRRTRTEKGTSYDRQADLQKSTRIPLLERGDGRDKRGQGGLSGEPGTAPSPGGNIQKPDRAAPSLKEKLFDKSVIGDLAKRNIEKEEKKESTFSFDAKEYRFLIYNRRLKERIESIWHYPPDAAAQGIYGDLVIRFTIKKTGQLGAVELVRTSGHKNLDDAAMEALREGAPYWPLPEEWGMEAYTIEGHFIYTIYGYYVR